MATVRPSAPSRVPEEAAPTTLPVPTYKIPVEPHMRFARMIARVVRADDRFNFRAGSEEERELELVAYMQLCMHAVRFDPTRLRHGTLDNLFQGWAKRGIKKEVIRAAEKIRARGLTQLPENDSEKPRCRNCSDVFDLMAAPESEADGAEEEECEPIILQATRPVRVEVIEGRKCYVAGG